MKRQGLTSKLSIAAIAFVLASAVSGQNADLGPGVVVKSEPGRATASRTAEMSAQVVAIDKAARKLTLKGPQGNAVEIVAGDEVKNFDQIRVGDSVVVRYAEALSLELRKTKGAAGSAVVREGVAVAQPGERPAVAGAREVTAIAEVTAVDPKKKTITLKGPSGTPVTLDVRNPEQFKVVKKGDQVDVTYTEAIALSVEPAAPKSQGGAQGKK